MLKILQNLKSNKKIKGIKENACTIFLIVIVCQMLRENSRIIPEFLNEGGVPRWLSAFIVKSQYTLVTM